jgi:adenosylcobyric acid synthase
MAARAIMFQGTGSSVGKSLLVTGLARACLRRGITVRPFKPQNMSNNAAVTADGGEIGRAQALQARAAGVEPSVHMNPVLLKPQSETGSQIVVQGRVYGNARAREYQALKPTLRQFVLDSLSRMKSEADIVLVEGAGSASEINLRAHDIANMGFARATDTPVVVIGDIDRGGVIASLVGTQQVIDPDDAALICGFVVNRMRGDPTLFADGMTAIAARTGWPPLGLVPFFERARLLPAEDSADLDGGIIKDKLVMAGLDPAIHDFDRNSKTWMPGSRPGTTNRTGMRIRIAVPLLPHIANFDDLDPLAAEPDVDLVMLPRGAPLPAPCDLVILPGSKATIADLAALRAEGWDIDLAAHSRRGGRVLGLCGGYQMLGRSIADPAGIEGPPEAVQGLGLLDVDTVLTGEKQLTRVDGTTLADGIPLRGYEMHVGRTDGPATQRPMIRFADGCTDGAVSANGRICGTYVHGFFADDRQRAAWLARLGGRSQVRCHDAEIDAVLDELAAHLESHMDIDRLLSLAR